MGMIKLSQKVKRPPVVGTRYWADRGMLDFMPSVAYDVPFEGTLEPAGPVIRALQRRVYDAEQARDMSNQLGVHIEVHDQGYLTITIGAFAS